MKKCQFCGKEYDDNEVKEVFTPNGEVMCACSACYKQLVQEMANHPELMSEEERTQMNTMGTPLHQEEMTVDKYIHQLGAEMGAVIKETSPVKLKEYLDEYVIGQENAKKILAVAVYNHYKRCSYAIYNYMHPDESCDRPDELGKSNIVMAGPSGTGKTHIIRSLAKKLNIPLAICDCTQLTESGFVGTDPENVVRELYNSAGEDIIRAQFGIIFLDEFDKLARKSGDSNMVTADPGREGVQQALLKIIEGTVVDFTRQGQRKHPDAPTIRMDTSNILFICGGAFDGIDKIIEKRVATPSSMGFDIGETEGQNFDDMDDCTKYNALIDQITEEDFKSYGIITEILGRLPVICKLHQLSVDDMVRILTEPKNAIVKQYQTLMAISDRINISFAEDALKEIASRAIKDKIGARGLRKIIEQHISEAMFSAPTAAKEDKSVEVIVTKDCIINNAKPQIIIKENVM